jgi:hypothetical protein
LVLPVESTWIESVKGEALDRAIWTGDQDFFGTGVATWSTATVQRHLES